YVPVDVALNRTEKAGQEPGSKECLVGLEGVRDPDRIVPSGHLHVLLRRERQQADLPDAGPAERPSEQGPEPIGGWNPSQLAHRRDGRANPPVSLDPDDLLHPGRLALDRDAAPRALPRAALRALHHA